MNKLSKSHLSAGLLLFLLLTGFQARADIVYPARLQLTEIAPGTFEVVFIIPVIKGRILKATPVFPDFCQAVSDPVIQVDAFQRKMRWQIRCTNPSLYGQQVGIEGLLGYPIDIILEINTLEGRTYQTTLSPTDSYFQIPPPPGIRSFLESGTLAGLQNVLWHWELILVFLAWLLQKGEHRPAQLLVVSILAASLGYFLRAQELFLVPSWAGVVSTLLIGLALLLPMALRRQDPDKGYPGLPMIGLGCLLVGGGLPLKASFSEYTLGERAVLNGFTTLGLAVGIVLLYLLARQFLKVLSLRWDSRMPALSTGLAGLALGVLLWKLSLFWNYPSMLPSLPWILMVFSLALSAWAAYLPAADRSMVPMWAIPAFLLGYLSGSLGMAIPYAWSVILAATAILPISLLLGSSLPGPVQRVLYGTGGITAGNYLFLYTEEFLSYPRERAAFFMVLLLLTACLVVTLSGWVRPGRAQKSFFKAAGATLLVLAILSGLALMLEEYRQSVAAKLAAGLLPLPLLSLGLLLIAFLIWPRYRKIHRFMGLDQKAPVRSLALMAAAFFLLAVLVQVRNPWHQIDLMDEKALHSLLEQRLWNTYSAFNIADEAALFEQLSENLDAELLDNIYLDSRRRLTMGLREGAQVTIKEVSLDLPEKSAHESFGAEGVKYPATWTVTAQVKHLRHIHYRKNRYTGTITMKPIANEWKISEIILTSEDREVIAASTL